MSVPEGRLLSRGRLALLISAFLLATTSIALLATGGFTTAAFGIRVSAHSPLPSAIAAAFVFVLWLVRAARQGGFD